MKPSLSLIWGKMKSIKLEKLFLILFFGFGLLFVAMVPPGWNTDEPDHTYRIYQLSAGNLLSEPVISPMGNRAFGGDVPSGLVNLYKDAGVRDAGSKAVDKTQKARGLADTHPEMLSYKNDGTFTSINFSGAALYSPITYAIYIPVFLVGQLLSLPFFAMVIIARVIGLIATGFAFYFAIKYIKIGKWILFVVGLLPTTVIQAASVGADAPLITLSVLFLAYAMNVILAKGPTTIKQYAILALFGMLLTFMKLAYAPFVLLILAIPFITRNINRRQILLAVAGCVAALVPAIIWTMMVSYVDTNSNLQANFPLQKEFILSEPIVYLKTLFYTFFTPEQAPLEGMFGTAIWGSVTLPAIFTYVAVAASVLTIGIKDNREVTIKKNDNYRNVAWRIALLAVAALTVLLIATVLYIYSSTLYQSTIIGLQSRYFIPLIPLILLAGYGNFVKNQKIVKIAIVGAVLFMLLGAVAVMYHRLYQTLPLLLG